MVAPAFHGLATPRAAPRHAKVKAITQSLHFGGSVRGSVCESPIQKQCGAHACFSNRAALVCRRAAGAVPSPLPAGGVGLGARAALPPTPPPPPWPSHPPPPQQRAGRVEVALDAAGPTQSLPLWSRSPPDPAARPAAQGWRGAGPGVVTRLVVRTTRKHALQPPRYFFFDPLRDRCGIFFFASRHERHGALTSSIFVTFGRAPLPPSITAEQHRPYYPPAISY